MPGGPTQQTAPLLPMVTVSSCDSCQQAALFGSQAGNCKQSLQLLQLATVWPSIDSSQQQVT
jgi:hypothetical protein